MEGGGSKYSGGDGETFRSQGVKGILSRTRRARRLESYFLVDGGPGLKTMPKKKTPPNKRW